MSDHSASIEHIKHQGSIKALQNRIEFLIHRLSTSNWENIVSPSRFIRLDEAITNGESILHEIRAVFTALQELDNEQR